MSNHQKLNNKRERDRYKNEENIERSETIPKSSRGNNLELISSISWIESND